MAENPLPQSVDLPIKPKERKKRSPAGGLPSDPREVSRAVPPVKRLLEERFGRATLRELSEKLGLDDVTPQLLSSSIAGNGAKRVRLAIAKALGEDADVLWPTARH
ncbi:MAG: hypothetical protein I4O48_20040 [Ralstonia sp.]|nr:hypothetical protein [Ralstonia sp.]